MPTFVLMKRQSKETFFKMRIALDKKKKFLAAAKKQGSTGSKLVDRFIDSLIEQ